MKKRNPFSSFDYLVDNLFTYQDKVEVKAFYIYRKERVMVKTITLKKINGKDEAYYLKEARRVVRASIKDGSLAKDVKNELAKRKKKRICVLSTTVGAAMIVGIAIGCYYGLKPPVYEIEVPDINGLMFDNNKPVKGRDYVAKFSINSKLTDEILPLDLSLVKVGNKNCEYTYTPSEDYLSATLFISKEYITDDVQVYFSLRELPWYLDKEYIKGLKEEDITKGDGVVKTVEVNGQPHQVRLIGVDHDNLATEDGKAHTTWEFETNISDADGYSLATPWNWRHGETSNAQDFPNSNFRKAIDGGGNANLAWYEKASPTKSTTYQVPVIDMLPKDLKNNLKEVKKETAVSYQYRINTYNTKLFPLSYHEVTEKSDPLAPDEGETYQYYKGAGDIDSHRIKHQVKWHDDAATTWTVITDPEVELKTTSCWNYAGFNSGYKPEYGGFTWLRSPITNTASSAWQIGVGGAFLKYSVYQYALAVAPAFCL